MTRVRLGLRVGGGLFRSKKFDDVGLFGVIFVVNVIF